MTPAGSRMSLPCSHSIGLRLSRKLAMFTMLMLGLLSLIHRCGLCLLVLGLQLLLGSHNL